MWQPPRNNLTLQQQTPPPERFSSRTHRHNGTKEKLIMSEFDPQSLIIKDHNGDDVKLTWCPKFYDEEPPEALPPFPFQVYLTHGAIETIRDIKGFAERFACFIEWIGGVPDHLGLCPEHGGLRRVCRHHGGFREDEYGSRDFQEGAEECHYRFEVYTKPQSNVLACVAHQRKEIRYRGTNAIWPRLVSKWTTHGDGYKGRIIVIDRDDWAEAGVVLVFFDPAPYDHPSQYTYWNVAVLGDHNIVEAGRIGAQSILRERLRAWWVDAGHSWAERDLRRRNDGAISPALYPAVDPMAHYDVEHEDVHELDGTALSGPVVPQNSTHPVTGDALIIDSFDKNELFQRGVELECLRSESYNDNFGLPVTSVWDPKLSKLRSQFSMTIYLSFDMIPVESKALFNCLNKGLIANEAWTLDVVRNMPNLGASFDYHSRASIRRTRARTSQTSSCMQMLLHKITGDRLPAELLDYIKELLIPPEIPDYSSRQTRLFKKVFMYLDASSLSTGPRLVYSDPASFWPDTKTAEGPFSEPGRWSSAVLRGYASQNPLLRVANLRYWHRVADEIHILWSFCSPRLETVAADMPHISLTLKIPQELRRTRFMDVLSDSHFELHFSRPITVPIPFLSHHGAEAFEIVDLETGRQLKQLPYELQIINSSDDSWSQSPELGYNVQQFNTLLPSSSNRKGSGQVYPYDWNQIYPYRWNERLLYPESLLVEGHRYRVRLRPDVTVPRWTYFAGKERSGPYNLPAIEVVMSEESQLIFRYVGGRE